MNPRAAQSRVSHVAEKSVASELSVLRALCQQQLNSLPLLPVQAPVSSTCLLIYLPISPTFPHLLTTSPPSIHQARSPTCLLICCVCVRVCVYVCVCNSHPDRTSHVHEWPECGSLYMCSSPVHFLCVCTNITWT